MSELLEAIRSAPGDTDLRRVYADWLEEHGTEADQALAGYLRTWLALQARPDHYDREAQAIRAGLEGLRKQHRAAWLGPLASLPLYDDDELTEIDLDYRSGLLESVSLPATKLLDHGDELAEHGHSLRQLTLYDAREHGAELADCAALAAFHELTIAGWITADDAKALGRSRHLKGLRRLDLWLHGRDEKAVVRHLAGSKRLEGLREVVLHQFRGALDVGDPANDSPHADALAARTDEVHGRSVARVERPWDKRFPLRGTEVGYDIIAGRLPGEELAIVYAGRQVVLLRFDAEGRFLGEEQHDFDARLPTRPPATTNYYDQAELLDCLGKALGFTPALIGVREFPWTPSNKALYLWPSIHMDVLEDPDGEEGTDPETERSIDGWLAGGCFVLSHGEDYWADRSGRIHTS